MTCSRLWICALAAFALLLPAACGGSSGPSGPTPAVTAITNTRPVIDPGNVLMARSDTWLAGVPVQTTVTGANFDPGCTELFYDSALGAATPIGGGAITGDPTGPGTRTVTPVSVTGWTPAAAGLPADTPTTLRVTNPDGQFGEMDGLTWARTGALANVNVSQRPGDDGEIAVAVNPAAAAMGYAPGSNAVVVWATGFMGSGTLEIYASVTTDFGRTWSAPTDIGPLDGLATAVDRSQPQCAFDRFGNLQVWWLTRDPGGPADRIGAASSVDGGVSFTGVALGAFVAPITSTTEISNLAVGLNNGAFAPGGSVFLVGLTNGSVCRLLAREFSGLGSASLDTLVPGIQNDAPPAGASFADLGVSIGRNGEFVVTWIDTFVPPSARTFIWQDYDADGLSVTNTFGVDNLVATAAYPPDFAPIPSQPPFPGIGCRPVPVMIPAGPNAGRIVVAYQGVNEATWVGPPGDHEVFTTFSDNNGVTWSAPTPVHPPNANDQTYAWLSADPVSGALYATWFSTANHAGNVLNQRFSAASADGATWSAPLLISQGRSDGSVLALASSGYGQYQGHAAWGHFVYAAWADNSNVSLTPPFAPIAPNPDGSMFMDVYTTLFMQR